MNIAYILPEFVTEKESGGLATYYDIISRLLADAGHIIMIFVQSDTTETLNYYPGVTVERVHIDLQQINPDIPGSFIRSWSEGLKTALCQKLESGMRFDLVQYPNFMGYGIDRVDIPTVIRVSSYRPLLRAADKEIFDIHGEYLSIKAPDFIEDIAVMKADAVYSPSVSAAAYVKQQTGKKVRIIESPYYPRSNSQYELEKNKAWIKEKKYAITFGTLKVLKGAKLIGDSIYEILEECPDLYWVFAGAEADWMDEKGQKVSPSQYIKKQAKQYSDRLLFLGKLRQEELFAYVKGASFCVMPSRVDNLPNTCIEAMALGKVVIGTEGASFEQLLENGKSGFLIERENREMLVETVCKAYGLSKQHANDMGMKAQERLQKMSPDVILEELVDFYNSVIEGTANIADRQNSFYDKTIAQYNRILKQCGIEEAQKYLL